MQSPSEETQSPHIENFLATVLMSSIMLSRQQSPGNTHCSPPTCRKILTCGSRVCWSVDPDIWYVVKKLELVADLPVSTISTCLFCFLLFFVLPVTKLWSCPSQPHGHIALSRLCEHFPACSPPKIFLHFLLNCNQEKMPFHDVFRARPERRSWSLQIAVSKLKRIVSH